MATPWQAALVSLAVSAGYVAATWPLARVIFDTVPSPRLTTPSSAPSGVMASPAGLFPNSNRRKILPGRQIENLYTVQRLIRHV